MRTLVTPFLRIRAILASLVLGLVLSAPLSPSAHAQEPSAPLDRQAVEAIIRDYLVQNPEIIAEAFRALERKQVAVAEEQQREAISAQREQLLRSENAFVGGNPEGDVTLVEFYDYNCAFCKRALSDLHALLESDPNLRVVLKEWPFLSPESVGAAKVSLAAWKADPSRFLDFHDALLGGRGQASEETALAVAEAVGYDPEALRAGMQSPDVLRALEESMRLGESIGVTGTPAYVIGDQLVLGAQGVDTLKKAIAEVRESGCKDC